MILYMGVWKRCWSQMSLGTYTSIHLCRMFEAFTSQRLDLKEIQKALTIQRVAFKQVQLHRIQFNFL